MKTIMMKTTGWLIMAAARMEGKAMAAAARTRQALTLMAAAAVMGLATASCSSEDGLAEEPVQQPAENTDAVKKYTMTVTASKGDDAMTRALTYDSGTKTLDATWTAGDEVKVYALNWEVLEQSGKAACNVYLGTLTAQSDGVSTTLDGTITAPPAVPEAYQSEVSVTPLQLVFPRFPLVYTGQKGTLDDIAANFDYAACQLYNWTETDGKISFDGTAEFQNGCQSIVRFTLQDKAGNAINAKSLTLHDASEDDFVLSNDDVSATFGDLTISLDDASSEVWVSIGYGITTSSILEMTATTEDGETYTYSKTGVNINRGKFYSITVKMERQPRTYDLSQASSYPADGYGGYVLLAKDGDVLTGTFVDEDEDRSIRIADGATVTLRNATINHSWNTGLEPLGDATIILEGENTVSGGEGYPGISAAYFREACTLTIKGSGLLTATGGEYDDVGCAGIGGIYDGECGNIVIESGTIIAIGGAGAPGIGGGSIDTFGFYYYGDITISGGNVTATGGSGAPGIGGVRCISETSCCGNITISSPATVTATKGTGAPYSIGPVEGGECKKVTIYGTVYWDESDSYYNTKFLKQSPLKIHP